MIDVVSLQSRTRSWIPVVLVLLVVVIAAASYLAWRQTVPRPRMTLTPPRAVGHTSTVPLVVEAARGQVASVEVRVRQGGKTVLALKRDGALGRRVDLPLTLESAALGLHEGEATLEVSSRDDFWRPLGARRRAVLSVPLRVDLTPPRIDLVASTKYLAPGGAGVVVFRVSDAARTDVRVGALVFPSFEAANQQRVALVALPHDHAIGTPLAIFAEDEAGNAANRPIPGEILPRRFRRDRIEVKDDFLAAKIPELLPRGNPGRSPVESFLVINRDLRRQAEAEKRTLAARTAAKPLWAGAFVQPRNTKVFSNFAEARTYVHDGQEIDRQIHFGFDLASTKQAPVPAANAGTVVFAGPLTIYGNTIVLDHGWGLMTLYGHLSTIAVKPADPVAKGQEMGRTGATGLAIGDHLHYEVLVNGTSVTPVEWWDPKWIRDRVNGPLKTAGLAVIPGVGDAPGTDATRPAPARPRARPRASR